MSKYLGLTNGSRVLAVLLAWLMAAPLPAQTPAGTGEPNQINILILEGEGAINNVRQRVAREAMVQVEDENHKPIAGAAVTFFLPGDGASGVFANGARSITILSDEQGKVAVRGMQMNKVAGKVQIRVQANYKGRTSNATISQTNVIVGGAVVGGAVSGKLLAWLLIGAAGAAAGGFAIANSGGGGAKSTPTAVVSAGTPTVGHP